MTDGIRILCIAGARPNFMKVAALLDVLGARPGVTARLVHTGQHYDERLSRLFFEELGIPRPDRNLEVGGGTHAEQTAEIMRRFEPALLEERPDALVVVGDVNSTIACALVATKLGVPVAHVEAGLRSFDRTMPEEINRILTDAISDLLFASEPAAVRNLRAEGVAESKVRFVGNVMIDTLRKHRERAERSPILAQHGLLPRRYAVLTLHRPSNVDERATFSRILDALEAVGAEAPIIFPVHPRTVARIRSFGLEARIERARLQAVEPLGYLDFLKLEAHAGVVLTDSGGVQEETTALGVPCVTIRENTERPITIEAGTNVLAGTDPERIAGAALEALGSRRRGAEPRQPPLWDGRASERIADALVEFCRARRAGAVADAA